MSEQKIFAGPRIKRLRTGLGLSQAAMADGLGISASYLNLIERNQRPLTVQIMMKLASAYQISPEALDGDADGTVGALKSVFADPLLEGELPGYEELFEVADAAPNVANGILKLHEGYRRSLSQLSDLNAHLSKDENSTLSQTGSISERVFNELSDRPNYYPPIEEAAKPLSDALSEEPNFFAALQNHLLSKHHIRLQFLPHEVMPDFQRRFDKHSMRLFVSERLPWGERFFEVAKFLAQLELDDALTDAAKRLPLHQSEASAHAKQCLLPYAALAIMMPYRRILQAADRAKYDIAALADRFGVTHRMVMRRLTSLAKPDEAGIPFQMVELNSAAQPIARYGTEGFAKHALGQGCGRLNLFRALRRREEMQQDLIETEREQRFAALSYFNGHRLVQAYIPQEVLGDTIYHKLANRTAIKTGVNCRLCERAHCAQRSAAPLIHPPSQQDHQSSVSPFDFDI